MTGKHRDYIFRVRPTYSVGTTLRLEKILKEGASESLVHVRAKKGYGNDIYILHTGEPKKYVGKLVMVIKVESDFMHYTYHLRPSVLS